MFIGAQTLAPVQRRTAVGRVRRDLFGASEAGGLWLVEPQYCYTDDGITNCTAPGDLVYRVDDISGNGNHAVQATEAARPALGRTVEGGRRNILLHTEDFSKTTYWQRLAFGGGTLPVVTPNAAIAPDGTQTAAIIEFAEESGTGQGAFNTFNGSIPASTQKMVTVWVRARTPSVIPNLVVRANNPEETVSITSEWTRITINVSNSVGLGEWGIKNRPSISGNGAAFTLEFWHPQVELGSVATPYQRIGTTALDVTEAGKSEKWYLKDDGIDDSLVATFSASLGAACTTNIATSAGITTLTAQTIGTTYDILQSAEVFGAIVTDDALTAYEQAKVNAYLGGRHP